MIAFVLFLKFAKLSLFCVGGGYMLIPLLIREFTGEGNFLSLERFANLVSVAQLTPGPVGLNTATYVGFLGGGVPGAVCATAGLVFPTLFMAGLAISFIRKFKNHAAMQKILHWARVAGVALICFSLVIFAQLSIWNGKNFSLFGALIALGSAGAVLSRKIPVTAIILLSAILGAVFQSVLN